ncbi:RidA family protein [Bradyrhizobium sp. CCBAU 53421]|uniref:RidA family protein n=1 Tax=Bradyrhizobium sp. CCBAU 53421 TaxID=1325120 RepID=UPI00353037F8
MPPPVANYVDAVRVGNLLFLSGNTPAPGRKYKGKVGRDLTVQEGHDTARQVGLIMLANVRAALGSLDRVKRVVKVFGMVNSADGFGKQPKVVNGFSDLMVEVFGEANGKHARPAVGMAGLPSNNAVEVGVADGDDDVTHLGAIMDGIGRDHLLAALSQPGLDSRRPRQSRYAKLCKLATCPG